jgi:TPR repeat protein
VHRPWQNPGMHRIALVLIALTTTARADEAADLRACKAGKAVKCEELSERYLKGEGAAKNPVKSLAFLEKACGLKASRACNNVGTAYAGGKNGAAAVDHAKARTFYEKACGMKNGLGCFNLGNVFRIGEGTDVDLEAAFASFKKSCELDEARGCTEQGIMYYKGTAVEKDAKMALTLLEKACKLGSEIACKNVEILKKAATPGPR